MQLIERNNICYHLYGDDDQLYLAFTLAQEGARDKMINCARDVKSFLTANKIMKNDNKTIYCHSYQRSLEKGQLEKMVFNDVKICTSFL